MVVNSLQIKNKWDVVLQKNAKNTMEGTCEQWGSFGGNENEEDTYTGNQRDIKNVIMRKDGLQNLTHIKSGCMKLWITYLRKLV